MSNQCSKRVYAGSYSGHQCQRRGSVEENGSWWCKQHAPSLVKARRDESDRKWREEFDRKMRADREREAENKRRAQWAKHGPELLQAAKWVNDDCLGQRTTTDGTWPDGYEDSADCLREAIAACEKIDGGDDDFAEQWKIALHTDSAEPLGPMRKPDAYRS